MSTSKSPANATEKVAPTQAVETQTAAPAVLATPPVKAVAKRKAVVKTTAKPSVKAIPPVTADAGKKPASKTVAAAAKD